MDKSGKNWYALYVLIKSKDEKEYDMKKWMKKLLTLCLALTMVVSVIAPVTAEAKTRTKSITLYKGEAIYVTDYSKVKSASSSKKSVVKVEKDKKDNTHTNV